MKVKIILFLFCSISINALSQAGWICGNNNIDYVATKSIDCSKSSTSFHNFYRYKESYIPNVGSNEGFTKTIHVSFHIWQRSNGTGNFDDTPSTTPKYIFSFIQFSFPLKNRVSPTVQNKELHICRNIYSNGENIIYPVSIGRKYVGNTEKQACRKRLLFAKQYRCKKDLIAKQLIRFYKCLPYFYY